MCKLIALVITVMAWLVSFFLALQIYATTEAKGLPADYSAPTFILCLAFAGTVMVMGATGFNRR